MRTLIALALSTTLIASTAVAADVSPLTAGKPAGVKQAQMMGTTGWVLVGTAALVGIVAAAASSGNGSPVQANPPLAVTTTTI